MFLNNVDTTKSYNIPNSSISNQKKTYTSSTLKISIEVPKNFEVEDKLTAVLLKRGAEVIKITRIGTNYQDAISYIRYIGTKNKFETQGDVKLNIGGMEAIRTTIKHAVDSRPDELTYFIYRDYFIYSFSTSAQKLYDDLDQIAQSFRYAP